MAVGPQSSVNVSVNFQDSTNSLSREINRGLKGFNVQGMRGLDTAFGNITKNVRTFDTALDRANQRVILFAASASILYGTIRAFGEMAKATVDVEKSMISINSVFRLTNQQLDQFSKGLFNVALSTSQSFDKVAEAAQEFSRQGLSASETIKRTRDAMVLTRLAAIDTAEAVTVLTATINGFAKEGLNSTQITNRLATVDAAFAVSTKDLVGALTRVGSAASDAGLSFNELVGLVTTAKQITGREGPVIAQALNTIFTRLNRKDTIDALDGLGVSVRDLGTGALLPTLQILQNFSSSYDQMTGTIKTQAAELVGGVRNLNTLKAVIGDLAKGNSVYSQTQLTLSQTTNQAYLRNEELNTSLEATIQRLGTVNKQVFANVGQVGFAGPIKTFLGGAMNNPIMDALRDATGQAETTGGKVAEGFLKGFGGAVIFGLGPIIVKGLFAIIKNTLGNLVADVALAGGLTKESQAQAVIQNQIVALYGQGNAELAKQLALTTSIAERALIIKAALESNVSIGMAAESQLAAEAAAIRGLGYRPFRPKTAAGGYIPGAMNAETAAIGAGVGGAPMGARPVLLPSFNFGGGKSGPLVANSSEFLVPHMAGGSAIYNRDMIRKFGLPPGATPVAAGGWVPNAAFGGLMGMGGMNSPYDYPQNMMKNPQMISAGSTMATTVGGAMGLQQVLENEVKQKIILEKQKQNVEFEARVLSQRKAAAEGEIKAFVEEKARVEAIYATNTKIFRNGVNALGQPYQRNESSDMVGGNQGPETARSAAIRAELARSSSIGGIAAATKRGSYADLSDAETAALVYRQQMVEEKQGPKGSRQKEIVAQNKRLDILRTRLQKAQEESINTRLEVANEEKATSLENLGIVRRQAILNQANARLGGGASFEQLSMAERAAFVQQSQLKAAKGLGFGGNLSALNPLARSQINLQVARDIYATRNYTPFVTGGMIGPPSPFNTENGAQPGFFSRMGNRLRSPMGQFGTGIALSFAGGMISEGKGGTREGMVRGAASSGLEMAGLGMQFGGPMGAGIGAVVGGLYGFLSKINKSFSELAGEIDESKKKLAQELEAAVDVFRTQDKIKEALEVGDLDRVKRLQQQRATQIAGLSPKYQQFVTENINSPTGMARLLQQGTASNMMAGTSKDLLAALYKTDTFLGRMGFGDVGKNEKEAAVDSITSIIGSMSKDQLLNLRYVAKQNPQEALSQIGALGGLTKDPDFIKTLAKVGTRGPSSEFGITPLTSLTQQGIFGSINNLFKSNPKTKALEEVDTQSEIREKSLVDLAARLQREARSTAIISQANEQIAQARQQINLANPALGELEKLQLTGAYGASKIFTQIQAQRQEQISSGKEGLVRAMQRIGVTDESISTVKGISGLGGFVDLKNRLLTEQGKKEFPNLGAPNSPFLKTLETLINVLTGLDETEKENTRANYDVNNQLQRQLNESQTMTGATAEDTGAFKRAQMGTASAISRNELSAVIETAIRAEEEAAYRRDLRLGKSGFSEQGFYQLKSENSARETINNARGQNQAIIDSVRGGSRLFTGGQLESALMGNAQDVGRQGKSKQSFLEGFHAKFEGLKQDIKQFAEVGAAVANSLENNLGNAFGDFVTGAKKGKDAFRSFILGVLNDSARAFASKAVQGLLGMVFSSLVGGAMGGAGAVGQGISLAPGQSASGGFIGLAAGGRVPTMLTGGEYAFGPAASSRLGPSMLTGLNNGTIRKMAGGGSLVRGGSGVMDDVPAMLKPGTFIVKKAMTERYGVPFLSALANGGASGSITMGIGGETTTMMSTVNPLMRAMGGNITNIYNSSSPIKMAGGGMISAPSSYPVMMAGGGNVSMTTSSPSSMMPIRMAGGGMLSNPFQMMADGGTVTTMTTNAAGLGGGNSNTFNIGVTVNDNSSSSSSSQTSAGGSPLADRKFAELMASRMKQVALQTIEEQTRLSGMLRRQSLRST